MYAVALDLRVFANNVSSVPRDRALGWDLLGLGCVCGGSASTGAVADWDSVPCPSWAVLPHTGSGRS